MSELKVLAPAAVPLATEAFCQGLVAVDFSAHEKPFGRPVDLTVLARLLEHTRGTFSDPVAADGWLAPRLHASLRLTRGEAAQRGVWSYLGLVAFPDYVRWRFTSAKQERFSGTENNHALGRLWWGAELIRNGPDYADVPPALRMQDILNTWLRLDAFHHRPTAIAAVRFLGSLRAGALPTSHEVNLLATGLNAELMTLALDSSVPDHGPGTFNRAWLDASVDFDSLIGPTLPTGPADTAVGDDAVAAATALLERVAADLSLGSPPTPATP